MPACIETNTSEKNPNVVTRLQCVLCKRFDYETPGWYKTWDKTKALCKFCICNDHTYSSANLYSNEDCEHDDEDCDCHNADDNDEPRMPVHILNNMDRGYICSNDYKHFFERNKIQSETFLLNTSKRLVGCEIEIDKLERPIFENTLCNKIQMPVAYNNAVLWDAGAVAVYDGSLSNTGFEICTFPANGDAFFKQIESITTAINRQRAIINSRCGMHIHVDASDFDARDVCNFMKLYCLIENAVFSTLPSSRNNNRYCKKITSLNNDVNFLFTKGVKAVSAAALSAYEVRNPNKEKLKALKQDKKPYSRYKAVNLSSWFYQGTIEFRMFNGTTDYTKITNWCTFWANLLTLVKTTLNTPKKIYNFLGVKAEDVSNLFFNKEESWKALMKVCSSDKQRNWFTKRRDKFQNI